MKIASVRKVVAVVFALFIAGGSLASAAGSRYFGESTPGHETVNGGSKYFGE